MSDQAQKITGYRQLTQAEIDLVNEGKALAEQVGVFMAKLQAQGAALDQRAIALGKTNLQQGFMWTTRGITQPTTF